MRLNDGRKVQLCSPRLNANSGSEPESVELIACQTPVGTTIAVNPCSYLIASGQCQDDTVRSRSSPEAFPAPCRVARINYSGCGSDELCEVDIDIIHRANRSPQT